MMFVALCLRCLKNSSFLKANRNGFRQAFVIIHIGGNHIRNIKFTARSVASLVFAKANITMQRLGTA